MHLNRNGKYNFDRILLTELRLLKEKKIIITSVALRQIFVEELHQGKIVWSCRRDFSQQKMIHQLNFDKMKLFIHRKKIVGNILVMSLLV